MTQNPKLSIVPEMKQLYFVSIIALFVSLARAQDDSRVYQPAQMKADLEQLNQAITTRWSYFEDKTKNLNLDYHALLEQVKAKIEKPLPKHKFAMLLMKFVSALGDGHSRVISEDYRVRQRQIPIQIKEVKEGFAVVKILPDESSVVSGIGLQKGELITKVYNAEFNKLVTEQERIVSWSTPGMRRRRAIEGATLSEAEVQFLTITLHPLKRQLFPESIKNLSILLS